MELKQGALNAMQPSEPAPRHRRCCLYPPHTQVQYMASELHNTLAERNMLQGEMEYLRGMMGQLARLQAVRDGSISSFSSRRSSMSFASDYPPGGGGAQWDDVPRHGRPAGPPSVSAVLLRLPAAAVAAAATSGPM
jgi:hypothetical protein